MCGRFSFFIDDAYDEIFWIMNKLNEKYPRHEFSGGDIFPGANAPVYIGGKNRISVCLFRWGFPKYGGKGVVFNTRFEEAAKKPMWAESLKKRRCIIPATGFYEWDKARVRYHFKMPEHKMLYMAGIYNVFGGERCFSVMTTAASHAMNGIHERMPLILPDNEKRKWLDSPDICEMVFTAHDLLPKRL